jgi:hypothetical protein
MKHDFQSIDLCALVTVTGGADEGAGGGDIFANGAGPTRTEVTGEIHGKTPLVDFSGSGTYKSAQSNYATCMSAQPAGTSGEQMAKNCNPLATGN